MAREPNRLHRVSDLLKRELALLIQNEVRDPRIGMASITDVTVSRDLAHAEVFVTFLGKADAAESEEALATLNRAAGFLRSLLAKEINLRTTPRLVFRYDESLVRGAYLSGLIDEAIARDRRDRGDHEDLEDPKDPETPDAPEDD